MNRRNWKVIMKTLPVLLAVILAVNLFAMSAAADSMKVVEETAEVIETAEAGETTEAIETTQALESTEEIIATEDETEPASEEASTEIENETMTQEVSISANDLKKNQESGEKEESDKNAFISINMNQEYGKGRYCNQ